MKLNKYIIDEISHRLDILENEEEYQETCDSIKKTLKEKTLESMDDNVIDELKHLLFVAEDNEDYCIKHGTKEELNNLKKEIRLLKKTITMWEKL